MEVEMHKPLSPPSHHNQQHPPWHAALHLLAPSCYITMTFPLSLLCCKPMVRSSHCHHHLLLCAATESCNLLPQSERQVVVPVTGSKTDCNWLPQSERQVVVPVTESKTDCSSLPQSERQIVVPITESKTDCNWLSQSQKQIVIDCPRVKDRL